MSVLKELNEEALRILEQLINPCVFLFFQDFFAIESDPDHPRKGAFLSHVDDATPHICIEGVGLNRTVKLDAWSQIMQNVLGVRFLDNFETLVVALLSAEQITFKGKIEDGPGKRLLFEALGSRTIACAAHFPREAFVSDILAGEVVSFPFQPEMVGVDFFRESLEELHEILNKLRSVRGEIVKRENLSSLKGDYSPFKAWAGIDPETGKVKTAQANNFNELFD